MSISARNEMRITTMADENPPKRRRREKKIKDAANRCEYFLERKNRRCAMQRKLHHRFCSEHMAAEASAEAALRIPCPLDPAHSVWRWDLDTHVKKCNARPLRPQEPWHARGYNSVYGEGEKGDENEGERENGDEDEAQEKAEVLGDAGGSLELVLAALHAYAHAVSPLPQIIETHPGLDSWYEGKENTKHIVQQGSLVGALACKQLLSPAHFYVEFGCGRAELSRAVNSCILHDKSSESDFAAYGFGLVDRGVNRMKMDSKIVADCAAHNVVPSMKRSRIDIEHLHLDKFLADTAATRVVGISKHLCGVATDLTLKLLLNAPDTMAKLHGLVVAMCCRHACDWNQLLAPSRAYLAQHGIASRLAFDKLKKIVPWAVSGSRGATGGDSGCAATDEEPSGAQNAAFSPEEKEALGLAARRMIDESRVVAVRQYMPGYTAELFVYASRATTPENNCLRVVKR